MIIIIIINKQTEIRENFSTQTLSFIYLYIL